MKTKIVAVILGAAITTSTMAGLTEFNWAGGANNGDATAGDQVMTYGGADVAVLEAAKLSGILNPADLSAAFDIRTVTIAPPFAGSTWGTTQMVDPTSDRVGLNVIAILDNDGIFTAGETITIASAAGPLLELDTVPAGLPQTFNPGATVSVQVFSPVPDTDGDGMGDSWELAYGLDPNDDIGVNGASGDPDGDGLLNIDEFINGSNPNVVDTDGDGFDDEKEVNTYSTDPGSADTDGDGLSDYDEVTVHGTDPNLADTDGDGEDDALEIFRNTDPTDADSNSLPSVFRWSGGTAGTAVVGDIVTTITGVDLSAFTGATIDIADLAGWIDQQTAVIAPPFAGGTWSTVDITTSNRVGHSVIAVIDNDGVFTVGETLNVSFVAGPLLAGATQTFSPNTVTVGVEVVDLSSAGPSEFNWSGGEAGTAVAGDQVTTFAGVDLSAFTGATINIADLTDWIDQQTAVIRPPFLGSTWGTLDITAFNHVGHSVIAIVDDDGVFTVGETLNVSVIAGPLAEFSGTAQTFSPNAVTLGVEVVDLSSVGPSEFYWTGGTGGTAVAGDVVTTFAGPDLSAFTGATIDLADLTGWIDQQAALIAPPFAGSTWRTDGITATNHVGHSVIAIVDDDGVFTIGETLNVSVIAGPLAEFSGTAQAFSPNAVTTSVQVVDSSSYWLDVTVVGSGSLNVADGWYPPSTILALTATPDAGWLFMGWSGDLNGNYTTAITNLTMNSDLTVTATFSDDADGDGLTNTQEEGYGTNPRNSDSDADGLPDAWEIGNSTDPLNGEDDTADPDNDGLSNAEEFVAGTSANNPDSDGDGMPDGWEVVAGLDPLVNDTLSDLDGDGLSALQEFNLGTDPNDSDSDDDLLSDLQEFHLGSNPNDADSDDDLLSDSEEVKNIVAWGDNYYKQTVVPSDIVNAVSVFAGGAHSLALLADGQIITWGDNYYGQCDVPASVSNVISIAAGDAHSLAALSNGTVVAWGDNYYQQLTVPPAATNVVAVSAGVEHSMALRADGHVVAWGDNYYGVRDVPPTVVNAVAIAAGGYHNLALLGDGQVVAWGDNAYGACDVPAGITNAVGIAAGGYHSVALLADGNVIAWGQDDLGQSSVPVSLSNAVSIAAGGYHSLALLADQSVIPWGTTFYGIGTIPSTVQYPVDITAGRFFSLALMSPTDPLDDDSDDDGLSDGDEVNIHGTNPTVADSDGDGLPDGWEAENGLDPLANDAMTDGDADGLSALEEFVLGTDPNNADSDGDGLNDGLEVNTYFSSPLDPDCDADGLLDGEEVALGTDLFDSDSDDDGLLDGTEVTVHSTNPLDFDTDDDGLGDGEEVITYTTDPLNGDTDGDTFSDGQEVINGGSPLVSDLWRIDHIRNHGSTYDLYPADSVLDLSIGQAGFTVTNGTAWLSLQLEESTDLNTWTNAGDEVIWSIPVDLDKAFYRVRSGH